VEEHVLEDGRRLHLLAEGRVINLAGAEGHPGAVMDMHFSAHALSVEHLAREGEALDSRVHPVPPEIDREIARLKLDALGVTIDELTQEQIDYLSSWEQGT
jgi:adenosylhomocysteinase